MSGAAQIDFSSIGGVPVQQSTISKAPIDFSSIGGKPVQPSESLPAPSAPQPQDVAKGMTAKLSHTLFNSEFPYIHPADAAAQLADMAEAERDARQQQNEAAIASGAQPRSGVSAYVNPESADDLIARTAKTIEGAASPKGVATAAATVAAPEIMGPALMAHGGYSAVKGWGDLRNPDVLENELNAAAETVGGAAVTGAAIKAGGGPITQAIRQKLNPATQLPAQAAQDLQTAIPPSKSAPYADIDMAKARPYLEAEHGSTPINSVSGLRDAADSAIRKIEDQIEQKIAQLPKARFKTNVTQDVTRALQANPRGQSFVDAGLKDLEDFHFDQPKTLVEADTIRRQLNLENQATLAKNHYKVAVARASDPAFAAREAAAESLRDGIYSQLGANGMPNAAQLRLDEGSLIKIRNAAQNQVFNGDKVVRSTTQAGPARQVAKAVTKSGATAAGAAVGGWPGAIVGREVGDSLGNAFTPEGLTRDALVKRSFAKPVAATPPARAIPATVSVPAAAVSSAAAQPRLSDMLGSSATVPNF